MYLSTTVRSVYAFGGDSSREKLLYENLLTHKTLQSGERFLLMQIYGRKIVHFHTNQTCKLAKMWGTGRIEPFFQFHETMHRSTRSTRFCIFNAQITN